ncbi:hypothetical protein [Paracoccus methylarcula]|uniref:hypothetical protein n=1 Tax=Paracoccus methylarcula TaxID=72022 RepID=UPI0011CE5AE4|nr:hypothetical protein [Paracoccus methylarcula]
MTAGIGPLRWYEGLFLGLVAAVLMGRFLIWLLCDGTPAETEEERRPLSFPADARAQRSEGDATAIGMVSSGATGDASVEGDVPETNTSDGKPADRVSIVAGAPVETDEVRVDQQPAEKRKKQQQNPQEQKKQKQGGKPAKSAPGTQGEPDDLKRIKGIGPKLEKKLRKQGVTRFAQIAEWGEDEMDHFAGVIGRMGSRIRGDDWVGQARILAQGGETEFSKRVEEGDIY